jgi:probable F420-dependent oxidoreductase
MLTFLAAHTTRVKLGTGVVILPQRNPLILAKQLASIDELSNGRLLFGLGVGHLQPEMEALGVPFNRRGAIGDEYLAAMHALWHQSKPAYQGKYVAFSNVQAHPQRDVQLVVGGHSPAAYRRAVKHGRGWYGYSLEPDAAEGCIAGLQAAAAEVDRPAALGELEISISPPRGIVDRDTVARYAALGVKRLILLPPLVTTVDARLAFIAEVQHSLIN